MNNDKITAIWEEDGDLMRLKKFFAYVHQDDDLKERIKKKTLDKIEFDKQNDIEADIAEKEYKSREKSRDKDRDTEADLKEIGTRKKEKEKLKLQNFKEKIIKQKIFKVLSSAAIVVFAIYLGSTGILSGDSPFRFGALKGADQVESMDIGSVTDNQAPFASRESALDMNKPEINPTQDSDLIQQKIIYVLEVTLKSDDVLTTIKKVEDKVTALGGYVAESRQNSHENKMTAYLTLKIPAKQFESIRGELPHYGIIADEHLFTDDITNQYFDVQSRLRSWEAQEKRYLEILKEAKSVEDILRIEDSLANVRREMESLKGQLKFWDNRVQYSEIRMNIYPTQTNYNVNEPWQPVSLQSTIQAAKNAVIKSISMIWNGINYILIFIGYALPVVILAFLAWVVYRFYRKRK